MTSLKDDESGVSLVELIIYMLLASVILASAAMILVNSWNTQKDVTTVSEATNRGQSMGYTIERAMRNGLAFEVSAGGTELRVRTSLGGNLTCQGFLLTSGTARLSQSSGALPSSSSAWTLWEQGIEQDGSSDFFTSSGQIVDYTFKVQTESAPVRISGEASTRSAATGVSSPCW
jgi:Tfp pilus assembly protein PilW